MILRNNFLCFFLCLTLFGFCVSGYALAEKWDKIPEKYKLETIGKMYEKMDISGIYDRCSEGIEDKTLPDEYKSILYAVRAKTYLTGEKSADQENALKAGLDCIRSNHLDQKNFSCVEVLSSYLSVAFLMTNTSKDGGFNEKDTKQAQEKHNKMKTDFYTALKEKAVKEKIEGVDDFFKNMPQDL